MSDYRNDPPIDEVDMVIVTPDALDALDEALAPPQRPADRIRAKAESVVNRAEAAVESRLGEGAARRVRLGGEAAIDRTEDAIEAARRRLDRELLARPYQTLAIATGAGLVLGLWLARR